MQGVVRSSKSLFDFEILFARGAMVARQVLTLKIEVRVLAGEPHSSLVYEEASRTKGRLLLNTMRCVILERRK